MFIVKSKGSSVKKRRKHLLEFVKESESNPEETAGPVIWTFTTKPQDTNVFPVSGRKTVLR